jgi:hypothetical protein
VSRPRLAAAGFYGAFVLLSGYVALALPPCAEGDELTNLQYVEFVRARRDVPDPWLDRVWNDKHPPLYYAAGAGLVSLVEKVAPLLPESASVPGPFLARIPLGERWGSLGVEVAGASIYALRGLSIACALLGLVFAGRCVGLFLPADPRAALGAVAFLAFNARFLFQSSVVNNDAASVALSSVAAWLLLRGVADEEPYRPALAGLVSGAAFLVKTNALFLLVPGLLVPWLRRGRGGRPASETLLFLAGWALPAGPWIARNLSRYGEPFGVGGVAARAGFIYFPGALSAARVDETLGGLFGAFWNFPDGTSPGRFATLLCGLLAGLGLVGSALRALRPSLRAEAPAQARAAALSLAAGAALYALVAAGNLLVPSMPGRLLFPGTGFYAVLLAVGLPVVLRTRPGSLLLPVAGAACAAVAGTFFLRTLLPRHLLPKSSFDGGTVAYLDCGHPTALAARRRGVDLEPHFLFGRPDPAITASVDSERVEYEVEGLDPSLPMRLEVTCASADVTYDDRWEGDFEPGVRHVVQRLRAGPVPIHGPVTVTHVPETLSYRLPPEAVVGGRLDLSFERTAGLYATVSEIRLRREADPLTAFLEPGPGGGLVAHVRSPGEAPFVSVWYERPEAPGEVLDRHLHETGKKDRDAAFVVPDLPRGRYRLLAARVDPERSPFATLEAETLPHPGWRVFGERGASGRYMVRATERFSPAGSALAVEIPNAPPGFYLASLRYAASGAATAGRAFAEALPDSAGRYREARALVPCVGGGLRGEVVFGGSGRLAVDRISFAPVAGPCARPEVELPFVVP